MEDFQLLFYIISLFAGVASITLAVFINIGHTKKALKYFIGLDVSLFIIQSMIALNLYIARTNSTVAFLSIISDSMDVLGTSFSTFFGLLFIHALLGKRVSKIKQILILIITAFQLIAITICYMNTGLSILKYIGQASLITVITYEALMVITNYHEITDKELKHASRIFSIITLSFLPFLALEYICSEVDIFKNSQVFKLLSLPTYFFIINIGTLIWSYTYFNTPAYIAENKLTEYFIKKYCITNKESEIIELTLTGLTYKQIAESLFISPKTVDNHVQSIYKKLKVTNKIQLSNLIHSKEQ
ncbi:response regulator transcription factor [Clostridium hydrogenum]|uniref:response regulator transcription factor n=1 Tax=Clostridium hydrogenum TaxID=2855764 RepID=UPI001F486586|nr:helix-turn-helix transcriptional regulator [Clostridium hydrogenum]